MKAQPVKPSQKEAQSQTTEAGTNVTAVEAAVLELPEDDYTYEYAYAPNVLIYASGSSCKLKVDDVDDTNPGQTHPLKRRTGQETAREIS